MQSARRTANGFVVGSPSGSKKADGSKREITYGYVLDLPAEARQQLLASDKQLQAWFQAEWSTEALALTVETVAANPLKRLWLWFVQPRRFREP